MYVSQRVTLSSVHGLHMYACSLAGIIYLLEFAHKIDRMLSMCMLTIRRKILTYTWYYTIDELPLDIS